MKHENNMKSISDLEQEEKEGRKVWRANDKFSLSQFFGLVLDRLISSSSLFFFNGCYSAFPLLQLLAAS